MAKVSYDNKFFIGIVNYDDGDLTRETVFRYRQKGEVVWGSFEGGRVMHGNFIAKIIEDDKLDMVWQYLNKEGELHTGICISTPELLPDGRIRLHESWQLTSGDKKTGESVIEELGG